MNLNMNLNFKALLDTGMKNCGFWQKILVKHHKGRRNLIISTVEVFKDISWKNCSKFTKFYVRVSRSYDTFLCKNILNKCLMLLKEKFLPNLAT